MQYSYSTSEPCWRGETGSVCFEDIDTRTGVLLSAEEGRDQWRWEIKNLIEFEPWLVLCSKIRTDPRIWLMAHQGTQLRFLKVSRTVLLINI